MMFFCVYGIGHCLLTHFVMTSLLILLTVRNKFLFFSFLALPLFRVFFLFLSGSKAHRVLPFLGLEILGLNMAS